MVRLSLAKSLVGVALIFGMAASASVVPVAPTVQAFTARDLMLGSRGDDVYELQHRLHFLGFYHGKKDGHFGWKTYWSVRNFQYKFGIKVTGRVNLITKQKLVTATKGWRYKPANANASMATASNGGGNGGNSSSPAIAMSSTPVVVPGLSSSDINLMAHVVFGEARGEPYEGQVAIAAVLLNRMHDPRFPHSIPAIVYQPGAFDAVNDGQINLQPNQKAMNAVMQALHGWDPSHGAVYYFNPATATSHWIWSRPQILTIGKHIFCS